MLVFLQYSMIPLKTELFYGISNMKLYRDHQLAFLRHDIMAVIQSWKYEESLSDRKKKRRIL